MKIKISKEWCEHMARLEGDAEIGAGRLALDPAFGRGRVPVVESEGKGPNVAFGRFVNLMRRRRGLTLEQLAVDADVDVADLVEIESDPHHRPEARTASQLAAYFRVPRAGLMQMAGLAAPIDEKLLEEGIRFTARSVAATALTPEEADALEAFVAALGGRT